MVIFVLVGVLLVFGGMLVVFLLLLGFDVGVVVFFGGMWWLFNDVSMVSMCE